MSYSIHMLLHFFLHHHHQLDCLKWPLTDYLKSILTNSYANSNLQFIYMPRLLQVSLKTPVHAQHSRFLPSRHIWCWLVIGNRHTLRGTVPTVHCEDAWPLALQLEILWRIYIICACHSVHVSSYSSVNCLQSWPYTRNLSRQNITKSTIVTFPFFLITFLSRQIPIRVVRSIFFLLVSLPR